MEIYLMFILLYDIAPSMYSVW